MRVTLLHNPDAGPGDHLREGIVAALVGAGFDVRHCSTKSDALPLVLREPADVILVAGGDGTVQKVATRLPDRQVPLAILPLGTANNIAHAFAIAPDLAALVEGWRAGRCRRFDIGLASGPWLDQPFVEAVGCGALAATMKGGAKAASEKDKLLAGRGLFARMLAEAAPIATAVRVDGVVMAGRWLAVEVLNLSHTGPRLLLAPGADPGDGLFDVLCLSEAERPAMLEWLTAPDGPPPVPTTRARAVAFEWDGLDPLRIDDALQHPPGRGGPASVLVAMQDRPLHVLVPTAVAEHAAAIRDER